MNDPFPCFIPPMLAVSGEAFDSKDYLYEPKWDGIRCQALYQGNLRLLSRNGNSLAENFPEMADLSSLASSANSWILDGELVVLDEAGKPNFDYVRDRNLLKDSARIKRLAHSIPALYVIFDLLYHNGHNLLSLPLQKRRELLLQFVPEHERAIVSPGEVGAGVAYHEAAVAAGLEGTVAKKLTSPYCPGKRSKEWVKVRATRQADCIIAGYTPKGQHSFGSLLLGQIGPDKKPHFIGHVGTGFTSEANTAITQTLQQIRTDTNPLQGVPRSEQRGVAWVQPRLVCVVEFLTWTNGGVLRHPTFRGIRTDKTPDECLIELDHPGIKER